MTPWHFPDPPEATALTLHAILKGQPALFVEHDESGGWRFLDNEQLHNRSELALAPLQRLVDSDPSLNETADLPAGWRAWRLSKDGPWEKESSRTLEKTRERMARLLAEGDRHRVVLPPGHPSTTEMLREDRDR